MSDLTPPQNFVWPPPWRSIEASEAAREVIAPQPYEPDPKKFTFEAELQHEVSPSHPLYQVECRVVGRSCEHPDEFIFATVHPNMPVTFVHLTWNIEDDPRFPHTVGYASWEAFASAWKGRNDAA